MVRGCQKKIIYLKNTGSEVFEEAYFVVRENELCMTPFDFKVPCYRNYENILVTLYGEDWKTPKEFGERIIPEFYQE
jgi:hypothetical protein